MELSSDEGDCTLNDTGVCIFVGNVQIRQGSLQIQSGRAELHRLGGDPTRALLTGSPVTLKQQMDDGTPMTARAAKVDYNLRTEVVVFTGNVRIEQPRGSMSGERVVYNLQTGRVESGGEGNGRVRMRILPRNARPAEAPQREDEG
jgi:lipopolysaccharide export system protein LptA